MNGSRLRAVDRDQPDPDAAAGSSGGGGGGDGIEIRLARLEEKLETHLRYLATKEDIQKIKVWCLGGVIGGMAVAAGLAVGILKLLS